LFPFAKEKNFPGMYEAFAKALESGSPKDVPTGTDGLIATRIARTATEDLIGRRSMPERSLTAINDPLLQNQNQS
ncbi:hypothetical protein AB4142_33765, partial [Variovorax sp. 2RAF20]